MFRFCASKTGDFSRSRPQLSPGSVFHQVASGPPHQARSYLEHLRRPVSQSGWPNSSRFPTHRKPLAYAGSPQPALRGPYTARRNGRDIPQVVRQDDGTDWPALSLRNFQLKTARTPWLDSPCIANSSSMSRPAYPHTKFCRMPRLTPLAL
jgi:hypothetical protein